MTTVNIPVTTGVGGDTGILGKTGESNKNSGGWNIIPLGIGSGQEWRILLRFDLSSIGSSSVCNSAVLKLHSNSSESSATYSLYEIASANGDWVEGSAILTVQNGSCCWNYKKYNTAAWAGSAGLSTAGTDYLDTVIGSKTASIANANDEFDIDFNSAGLTTVQSWFGQATNSGIILVKTGTFETIFYSGENATESYRPVLTVEYTEATALTASDLTLAPVTFDAPTLTDVASTVNFIATDLTLSPVTFDAPTLVHVWATPDCRTFTVEAESRMLTVEAENRALEIEPEGRGVKFYCNHSYVYAPVNYYNGLTGADLTLARATFDAPYVIPGSLVPEPDADFAFAPFYIIDDGDRTFTLYSKANPSALFDLQTYAGINVTKTYYVDKATGNDSNSGADWDNALATFKAAFAKSDVDRIYVKDGYYYHSEVFSGNSYQTFTRSVEIIGVTNNVTFSGDLRNELSAWTKVDNHYESNTGGLTLPIWALDNANLTIYGFPGGLTKKTTVAEVDATPNSWCVIFQSGVGWWVYLRTFDDRAPDNNIILLCDNSFTMVLDTVPGINVYIKNISFYGRCITKNSTASGNLYMEDCSFYGGITVDTGHEVILSRCSGTSYIEDAAAYASDTHDLHAIEIDCNFGPGRGGGSCQASTTHMGTRIIRVRGDYHGMPDHAIGDVHPEYGGKTWIIGSHIYDSGVGVWHMIQWCWLDTCMIENCTRGIQNNTDTTTYTHELVNACQNAIAGSLITYDR